MFGTDFTLLSDRKSFAFSKENPTGAPGGGTSGLRKLSPCVKIKPGETVVLAEIEGSGRIEHMWFGGTIHHSLILRMYWDNQEIPSVEAPISAFFGYPYHENIFDEDGNYPFLNSSVMMTSPSIGCNIYFPMPFHKHAKITLENHHEKDPLVSYYMITGSYGEEPEDIGYFHATYRQAHPVTRFETYEVLSDVEGKGQFLGVTMGIGLNGTSTCWCEGEVRMYLEGEDTPSLQYTGLEDYFCGSYSFGNDKKKKHYQVYSGHDVGMYAVIGNMAEQYNHQRRFHLYRFHLNDPIHFEKGFRMTMDDAGWTWVRYDDFTTVAYWYQTLPTPSKAFQPIPKELDMWML